MTALAPERRELLAERFDGVLTGPDDAAYETLRRCFNGMVDKHPLVIAECRGTADVAAAVRFAVDEGLEVAVRGGGHSPAGRAVCDGGLVIDLVADARRSTSTRRRGSRGSRAARAGATSTGRRACTGWRSRAA